MYRMIFIFIRPSFQKKVKVKIALEQATKAQKCCRGIPLLFLYPRSQMIKVVNDPRPIYPRERPGTHCTEVLVGQGAVRTGAENLARTGTRSPDLPARSESLYRLR